VRHAPCRHPNFFLDTVSNIVPREQASNKARTLLLSNDLDRHLVTWTLNHLLHHGSAPVPHGSSIRKTNPISTNINTLVTRYVERGERAVLQPSP